MSRSVPQPTADSAPFWAACRRGELRLPRCCRCDEWIWFPRAMCPSCSSTDIDWRTLSGHGTVYSFSVVHRPPSSDYPPVYLLALVDLTEGPRLLTHLIDCDPAATLIGISVSVDFDRLTSDVWLPVFRPNQGGTDQ